MRSQHVSSRRLIAILFYILTISRVQKLMSAHSMHKEAMPGLLEVGIMSRNDEERCHSSLNCVVEAKRAMSLMLFLLLFATTATAQQGALNIQCGANGDYNFSMWSEVTDEMEVQNWVNDSKYVDGGKSETRNLIFDLTKPPSLYVSGTLRYFSDPHTKSCYKLPVTRGQRYLLRLWFVPFKVMDATFSYTVEAQDILVNSSSIDKDTSRWDDWILFADGNIIRVCLIKGDNKDGDPYISDIQLIKLGDDMYPQARRGVALLSKARFCYGCQFGDDYRYPDDNFDRIWRARAADTGLGPTTENISYSKSAYNRPPPAVMRTAYRIKNSSMFQMEADPGKEVLVFLYFAYLWNTAQKNHALSFNITIDNNYSQTVSLEPNYQVFQINYTTGVSSDDEGLHNISFRVPDNKKALLNALEVFNIVQSQPRTASKEVNELNNLKEKMKINFTSWSNDSDPCFVQPWERIKCENAKVIELNFSKMNLTDTFPDATIQNLDGLTSLDLSYNKLQGLFPNVSSLRKLKTINLSSNKFNGPLPDWLFQQMKNLENLDLSHNNLQGSFPTVSSLRKLKTINLRSNKFNGPLPDWLFKQMNLTNLDIGNTDFSGKIPAQLVKVTKYDGNKHLTLEDSPDKWTPVNIFLIILSSVLLVFLIFLLARHFLTKKQESPFRLRRDCSDLSLPNNLKLYSFTMKEMESATQNFRKELGRGGFGKVYYGKLQDGQEIAVKVLSHGSRQGKGEFLNELNLLSEVNCNKLVRILGFCKSGDELMIVYEYVAGGSLEDHIHGSKQRDCELSWRDRLKIALDATQGLEYLHMNCKPKIIHRDLKSANILLDQKFNGKLSDFGLSKGVMEETTHVSTMPKGTIGYLDPEYFNTYILTEKSDVYSMGVVLLEIICGRKAVEKSSPEANLSMWVTSHLDGNMGKVSSLIDKRLTGKISSFKSVEIVTKVALRCVERDPSNRPSTDEVVMELKEALEEENRSILTSSCNEISIHFSDLEYSCSSSSAFHIGTSDGSTLDPQIHSDCFFPFDGLDCHLAI